MIEAVAALALVAVAGVVVAAAAVTSLRAVHQAEALELVVGVAARELATLQSRGAPAGTNEVVLTEPGLAGTTVRSEVVGRGRTTELTVAVTAERPSQRVTLTTRMLQTP